MAFSWETNKQQTRWEKGGGDKTETQQRGSGKESKERGQKVVREGTQKHNGDTPRQIELPAWSEEWRFEANRWQIVYENANWFVAEKHKSLTKAKPLFLYFLTKQRTFKRSWMSSDEHARTNPSRAHIAAQRDWGLSGEQTCIVVKKKSWQTNKQINKQTVEGSVCVDWIGLESLSLQLTFPSQPS